MNFQEKINTLVWRKWLERPFSPFINSLFFEGFKTEHYAQLGFSYLQVRASVYQNGYWYESDEIWEEMAVEIKKYLAKKTIFDITTELSRFYKQNKKVLFSLNRPGDTLQQLSQAFQIISTCTTFIFLANALEPVYDQKLKEIVPKYVAGDSNKFIGDASFPKKKNAHALMEEAIRRGDDPTKIAKKFGWLRARDGFSEPFTVGEIKNIAKGLQPHQKRTKVKIPTPLKPLFKEVQELVFFRTARTDVFYEFLYLARPIFKRVAEHYRIPFNELKHYTIQDLLAGKLQSYPLKYTAAYYESEIYISGEPLLVEDKIANENRVKGRAAFLGYAKGPAKIVRYVSELDKVKVGDILITQMTFPSFIVAMSKAAAFVTDEGGITCHAAIVAREMKKPCITGTKNATRIFKDGDIVEVDANKGEARLISKAK